MTDQQLFQRIMARLDALGMNMREASLQAGLNADAIRDIKRGKSKNISVDSLNKLAETLKCSVDYLIGSEKAPQTPNINLEATLPPSDTTLSRAVALPGFATMSKDVPVRGTTVGGGDGDFTMNGEIVDTVRRPPGLASNNSAFGLYVIGESMVPRFQPGELVFVNPNRPPTPGCDVIVEMRPRPGEATGPCYIKRLVKISADRICVREFHPQERDFFFERNKVLHCWRIMTAAELMGVG